MSSESESFPKLDEFEQNRALEFYDVAYAMYKNAAPDQRSADIHTISNAAGVYRLPAGEKAAPKPIKNRGDFELFGRRDWKYCVATCDANREYMFSSAYQLQTAPHPQIDGTTKLYMARVFSGIAYDDPDPELWYETFEVTLTAEGHPLDYHELYIVDGTMMRRSQFKREHDDIIRIGNAESPYDYKQDRVVERRKDFAMSDLEADNFAAFINEEYTEELDVSITQDPYVQEIYRRETESLRAYLSMLDQDLSSDRVKFVRSHDHPITKTGDSHVVQLPEGMSYAGKLIDSVHIAFERDPIDEVSAATVVLTYFDGNVANESDITFDIFEIDIERDAVTFATYTEQGYNEYGHSGGKVLDFDDRQEVDLLILLERLSEMDFDGPSVLIDTKRAERDAAVEVFLAGASDVEFLKSSFMGVGVSSVAYRVTQHDIDAHQTVDAVSFAEKSISPKVGAFEINAILSPDEYLDENEQVYVAYLSGVPVEDDALDCYAVPTKTLLFDMRYTQPILKVLDQQIMVNSRGEPFDSNHPPYLAHVSHEVAGEAFRRTLDVFMSSAESTEDDAEDIVGLRDATDDEVADLVQVFRNRRTW